MAKKKSGHGEIKLVKDLVYVNLFASEKIRPSMGKKALNCYIILF